MTRWSPKPEHYPVAFRWDEAEDFVFDPALLHYPHAFVNGPASADLELRAHVSRALERVVAGIAAAPCRDNVVVRGSVALEHWFGAAARAARDLDLVVLPPTWSPDCPEAKQLLLALRGIALRALHGHCPVIEAEISLDTIWAYERAEGRRIVLPWLWRDAQRCNIQIDVVFREPLCDPPGLESFGEASAWFASKAESLAWKLLWLETDMHAQGKDLYDACVLAQHVALSRHLLERVFQAKTDRPAPPGFYLKREWQVDWANFAREYPQLARGAQAADLQTWLAENLVLTP